MNEKTISRKEFQKEMTLLKTEIKRIGFKMLQLDENIKKMITKSNKLNSGVKNTFIDFSKKIDDFEENQSMNEYHNLIGGKS